MRKRIFIITGLFGCSIIFSSCSILVPYHEHSLCHIKPARGVCGSISKVYRETVKHPKKFGIKE